MYAISTVTGRGAATAGLILFGSFFLTMPAAHAGNLAERCTSGGCEYIHCNYTGDRCHHEGGGYGDYYDGYRRHDYGRYYGASYGYGGDYGYGHLVCDSDGDRCYRSDEPYWNYREYYRRHGYHWVNQEARYESYRFSDRLNSEEYEHHRYNDRDEYDYYDR